MAVQTTNAFPEYELRWVKDATGREKPRNYFRGVDLGMGGYVDAIPGMYTNVALLDSASHHPTSAIQLNYFGEYTDRFEEILNARIAIKHGDYETASKMFDGRLAKYLTNKEQAEQLAQALKIAINSVYGLTSAKFENPFFCVKNVNNIVALRGAILIKMLKDAVDDTGKFKVVSCRTDSIKIPNATPEIIQFVIDFGKRYGYTFEHECTYDRMCLVDNTNYIAKYQTADKCMDLYGYVPGKNTKKGGKWTATGATFAQPFVFKSLFSKEPTVFEDFCETKQVSSASIYLDFNEGLPDVSEYEGELKERAKEKSKLNRMFSDLSDDELLCKIQNGHDYKFIGRIGLFTPVLPGVGGAQLVVKRKDKYDSVAGAKGYRWLESEMVKTSGLEDKIDLGYYRHLVDDAKEAISQYGDFEWFANNDDPPSETNHPLDENDVPWLMPCKDPNKTVCEECSERETCPYISADGVIPWLCEDRDPLGNNCADCPNQDSCHDQMQVILDKEASEQFARR